ncbi:hypothetical protein MKQ68_19130 [Chitinophaga horti]|uniref:Uncharacterized protein n=1 Tax=Chitinophaga horti TaxID=2920382 RepID=A0ABY6J1M0_9BACT|nr:hypothetical protein [Chitinophaga horti]UYQ92204.1 hypothetical protein MKQ68_19130 [Chitinophaga horti]
MKNIILVMAVICTSFAATAITKSIVAPGDRYVQTSPSVYTLLTIPYSPSMYCDEGENPCSYKVPNGDNTIYGSTISIQTAINNAFIPDADGIYVMN